MRNLGAEYQFAERLFIVAGAVFLLGLIALAVGTELWVLSYFLVDPVMFWIWQGIWAVITAMVISAVAKTIKSNALIKHGNTNR